jgi:hypothetical protein
MLLMKPLGLKTRVDFDEMVELYRRLRRRASRAVYSLWPLELLQTEVRKCRLDRAFQQAF